MNNENFKKVLSLRQESEILVSQISQYERKYGGTYNQFFNSYFKNQFEPLLPISEIVKNDWSSLVEKIKNTSVIIQSIYNV